MAKWKNHTAQYHSYRAHKNRYFRNLSLSDIRIRMYRIVAAYFVFILIDSDRCKTFYLRSICGSWFYCRYFYLFMNDYFILFFRKKKKAFWKRDLDLCFHLNLIFLDIFFNIFYTFLILIWMHICLYYDHFVIVSYKQIIGYTGRLEFLKSHLRRNLQSHLWRKIWGIGHTS